jgi:hypothetical protein
MIMPRYPAACRGEVHWVFWGKSFLGGQKNYALILFRRFSRENDSLGCYLKKFIKSNKYLNSRIKFGMVKDWHWDCYSKA